jgi:hypothetical protein
VGSKRINSSWVPLGCLLLQACGSSTPSGAVPSASVSGSSGSSDMAGSSPVAGSPAAGSAPEGGASAGRGAGGAANAGMGATAISPLEVSPTGHYLVSRDGTPFQLRGDAPWTATVQLTREQVTSYLDNRKAKGFNAILVEVIERKFGAAAPANAYGDAPFVNGDFSQPNEAYWRHVDYLIAEAGSRGIFVLMCALYLGSGGGDEGWYAAATAAGAMAIERYGAFLGQRYRSADNIIWINGGDYRPSTPVIPDALAKGILSQDQRHLFSAHWARSSSGREGSPSWLTLNSTYTDQANVSERVLADYRALPALPTFLIESHYEGSFQGGPTLDASGVRQEAWQAILAGGCGHVYGNHTVWQFGSGWQAALDSPGAASMRYLHDFFAARPWWKLVPDYDSLLVTGGRGTIGTTTYVTAAASVDGTWAVAYIFDGRQINVDLARLASPVSARWFDPSSGTYSDIAGSPFESGGQQALDPPGASEAVLLLEAK